MVASMPVDSLTFMNAVAAAIALVVSATPRTAVTIGRPAAIRAPKVMMRTSRATAMPMISVEPTSGMAWRTSPPTSRRSPWPSASAMASSRYSTVASSSSIDGSV